MRKKIFIIAIFFLSFFFTDTVYAAKGDFIYDIESFSVTADKKIVFEGWAYLDGYHNNGGSDTKISIVAGGLVEEEAVYNSSKNRALYYSNCYKVGFTCTDTYETAKCDGTTRSNCRFDNVGFKIEFDIEELYEKFGDNKTIDFKIKISHSKGGSKTSNIAVSSYTPGVIYNNFTLADGTVVVVDVSEPSDVASIRKDYGRVAINTAGDLLVSTQFYWQLQSGYKISGIQSSTNSQYGGMKMYQLSYKCNAIGCVSGGHAIPGTDALGWAYASWVQINGSVKIKFTSEKIEEEESCKEIFRNVPDGPLICTSEIYEETITEDVSVTRSIPEGDPDYNRLRVKDENGRILEKTSYDGSLTCTKELKQVISSNDVVISQIGEPYFNIKPSTIYSGGGFSFEANYEGEAEYELCTDMEYVVSEYGIVYYCEKYKPNDGYKYDSGTISRNDKTKCIYHGEKEEKYTISEEAYNSDPNGHDDCRCSNGSCRCTVVSTKRVEQPSKPKCQNFVAPTVSCGKDNIAGTCPSEAKVFAETMSDNYLKTSFDHGAVTYSKDSNTVVNDANANVPIGNWTENYRKLEQWYPKDVIDYSLEFNLEQACINRLTAEVTYKTICDIEKEIDGGNLYYVPIKEPNREFPIRVTIDDLSIIIPMLWPLVYECGIDCQQKIYNDPPDDMSFKIIYRPITLAEPFPDRHWGTNWDLFMNDSNAIKTKLNRKTLEYSATLNSASIQSIKTYNKNAKKYPDMSSISYGGKSSFIDTYDITRHVNNYNKLGECTNECWTYNSNNENGGY